MNIVFRKLKSKIGESLVESLAAVLIFTMASIVMFTMITTATDLNMKVKEMDRQNQQHLRNVETGDSSAYTGKASVKFYTTTATGTTQKIADVRVDIYGGRDGSLYTYFTESQYTGG